MAHRVEILKAALELPDHEREKLVEELCATLQGLGVAGRLDGGSWPDAKTEAAEAVRRARGR